MPKMHGKHCKKNDYHPLFDFVPMSLIEECNDHLENSTWDPHCLHSFFLTSESIILVHDNRQSSKNGKILQYVYV